MNYINITFTFDGNILNGKQNRPTDTFNRPN
jgi:hypothetical protein